ncbi:MAG: LemA family protein [Clostridiales bacterium]|nr:LemA family protein [Clostridiales bacterium]
MQFLSLSGGVIGGIVGGAVGLIIVIIAIWYISTHNSFIRLKNDVEESFSAMDVQMKKRYDLIPNLVETCKGYAKHESETFTRVTEARTAARAARSGGGSSAAASGVDRISAERELTSSLRTLLNFVQEQYPQLKADSQFNNLSRQLEQVEEEIARSRKYYNAKIKIFNNKIEQFPSSIVANRMKLERRPYFEIEDEAERVAPKVSFN